MKWENLPSDLKVLVVVYLETDSGESTTRGVIVEKMREFLTPKDVHRAVERMLDLDVLRREWVPAKDNTVTGGTYHERIDVAHGSVGFAEDIIRGLSGEDGPVMVCAECNEEIVCPGCAAKRIVKVIRGGNISENDIKLDKDG